MVMKRVGLYPGTFDPITLGHLDIIKRAVKLVDHLVIGVATNPSKSPMFTLPERMEMMRHEAAPLAEGRATIAVETFESLLMQFAEKVGASVIIRGLRAVSDFEYEFQMVAMNQRLNSEIETVFLMADPRQGHCDAGRQRFAIHQSLYRRIAGCPLRRKEESPEWPVIPKIRSS